MNPTAIAFDRAGQMYVSSRLRWKGVSRGAAMGPCPPTPKAWEWQPALRSIRLKICMSAIATGLSSRSLRDRQIFVFAMLEPSVSAYHMAFGPQRRSVCDWADDLQFRRVHKIDPHGNVTTFYRGLGRPQGLAFDIDGNLYVAASLSGKRGIVKISPDGKASLEVAGTGLVGLAFAPGRSVILATTGAVHHLSWDIQGLPLIARTM